jgi:hypothetical protein
MKVRFGNATWLRAASVGLGVALTGCVAAASDSAETADLTAVSPSTETATVTLTETGTSTTQIAIATAGGTDTGAQSAEILTGTCGSGGAVLALLNDVQNDESITTVAFALSSLTGSKYYINVNLSTDVDTVECCGAIP